MQIGPRIRFDKHTLGNVLKNVSPALAFTPLGLAGTAAAAGLGEIGRGKHGLGDIAKSVGSNVAIGAGARGLAGHYGVLGQGGAAPVPAASTGPTPLAAPAPDGGLPLPSVPNPTTINTPPVDPRGFASKAWDTASSVGGKILDHDKTTAAVLGGLGNLGTMGTQNRQANAQTQLLEQQAKESEYDYNRRKAQDLALEPLRQALYGRLGQIGDAGSTVAKNPYTQAGA